MTGLGSRQENLPRSRWANGLWFAIAFAACLSVFAINGGALYYYDTAGYLEQGKTALSSLGWDLSPTPAGDGTGAAVAAPSESDGVVVGSRSAIYSVSMTVLHFTLGINALVILQVLALILAIGISARVALRSFGSERPLALAVAIPVLVACLGSLPFYTAYLMPDIFAPILILMMATLAVFARSMTKIEIVLAILLGCVAVVLHPSHLVIAGLMVPVVALAAIALQREKWWLAPVLASVILGGGLAERVLFASVVEKVQSSQVIYQPFLTARTIADGPGLRVLENNCPDETLATCALYDALQLSTDPWRLTSTHIIFETDPRLGSYRFLSPEDQSAVAKEQLSFFLKVLREEPVGLTLAFVRNTLLQANMFSVELTIPIQDTLNNANAITDIVPASFEKARLLGQRDALGWLTSLHAFVYAVSALLMVVIVVLPQKSAPLTIKGFAMMILIGILVNAFVCGGISQPSARYGARVAFLLPVAVSFILMFYSDMRRRKAP